MVGRSDHGRESETRERKKTAGGGGQLPGCLLWGHGGFRKSEATMPLQMQACCKLKLAF